MDDGINALEELRIYELKEKAINQFINETGFHNASINHSALTFVDKIEIVVIQDKDLKFLANYEHLGDNQFRRMDIKQE
jgi:ribosome-interacting GTPase 1